MSLGVSRAIACVALAGSLAGAGPVAAQTKLLRFPDIHENRVVFSYASDLWSVRATGGMASRLTAHPGQELFAKFSPDGQWIAFTGQYDGDEQVYVMPTAGGVPRQLTYYPARGPLAARNGYDHQVYGWTNDGSAVLFRSFRDDRRDSRLYSVSIDGGLPEPLPMPRSGAGDFSPDGRQVVYSPLVRDFRTWKRYQGGTAQDLWIFDLSSHEVRNITNHPRTDRDPMWVGHRIYFSSDRSGTLNLYAQDPASGELQQLTWSTQWDVRWPSADDAGRIVYELNGELHVLTTSTGEPRRIAIQVPDDGVARRPSRIPVSRNIEDFGLSPKGERALFVARGDIFTAPIEQGPTRNLTHSSNAHDKWARWSPDGSKIAFISDRSGEEEIYLINQDGSGEPEQLTTGGQAMRYAPEWSPDGKRLAFNDKDGKLYVLTLEDNKLVEIADDIEWPPVSDYAWSPSGGHLAFSLLDSNNFMSIYIWSVSDGQRRRITSELFHEFNPAWDPEGNYLYYLSRREFAPRRASVETNYFIDRGMGIFALALRQDVRHPFPPESDEVTVEEEETEEKDKEYIKIDFDGLAERVARVPVPPDNLGGLEATKEHLLYIRRGTSYYGRESDHPPSLQIFSMNDREVSTLAENVNAYALSQDGSRALVRHPEGFTLYDAAPEGKDSAKPVSTNNLMVDRVPAEEWAQIFDEVWRRFRDFFYVKNMHGYDWEAVREQYRPLLAHVAHRADLNYVIGEMIAELNVSHTYIAGGDYEIPERPKVALPGARFSLDPSSGRYRLAKIFRGQNEEERYRSPLTEIGIDVREGDYVLAIDGQELLGTDNPYRLLLHKADRPVQLTINDKPTFDGARQVHFRPITSETNLIYLDWVTRNRERVTAMTDGRVGYVHLPDMGANGIREFFKYFFGQIRKEGLIVDVRNTGGGNVSQMVIERLRRNLLGVRFWGTTEYVGTYPSQVFHGHMVALLNELSGSDADIFPYLFREAGLGPLIGKRSWGGVVGGGGQRPLIDGGTVYVPERALADTEGNWVIEGHGVDPDIEVENDPQSVIAGHDRQLERAIEEVMRRVREDPRRLPTRPAAPVKTKQPYRPN